jgi:acetoin utilization protein AcuB
MSTAALPTTNQPAQHVSEVMSKPVLTVEIDETLWDAWQLLFVSGLRHLVVIDGNAKCVGVLSDRNILADVPATLDHLGHRRVRDILARVPMASIHPDAHPQVAAQLMREHSIEAIPVLDDAGKVVGIVTESDVIRWITS